MPLLVSVLQGWSHIRKISKCEFGKTLLTQCNSCARRFVLSAKFFFLFAISLHFLFCASLSSRRLSRKFLVSKAFRAICLADFSHAILHCASDVYLKICVGYAFSKWSSAINKGFKKEERISFRA